MLFILAKIHNYGIKVPQFSFMQLDGADIALGVEMQSTGEAACFGDSFYDALSKGLTSVGYNLPSKGTALVTVGGAINKENKSTNTTSNIEKNKCNPEIEILREKLSLNRLTSFEKARLEYLEDFEKKYNKHQK